MIKNLNVKKTKKEINSEIYIDKLILNKSKDDINKSNNNTNILINSIDFFYNSYDLKNKASSSKTEFIINFNDLISLIKKAIIFQQKIDNLINNDKSHNDEILIQKINQNFINFISNSIYSFKLTNSDKIENSNLNKHVINLGLSNINISKLNKKKNKIYDHRGFSSSNIHKEIKYLLKNIFEKSTINENNHNKNNLTKLNKNKMRTSKSAILNKNYNLYSFTTPQLKNLEYSKLNKKLFKPINSKIYYNINSINEENKCNTIRASNKRNILKNILKQSFSTGKIKNNDKKKKKIDKNKLKRLDIYKACENISKIKNKGNIIYIPRNKNYYQYSEYDDEDSILKKSLKNVVDGIQEICKNNTINEIIGYEEINLKQNGIKKIIISNSCKPSNLTNKLLINGHKCIDNFKELNEEEEEKKKNINNFFY